MRSLRVVLLLGVAVATGLALAVGAGGREAATAPPPALDAATGRLTFALQTVAGEQLGSAQLRGRPAVLNAYASWCAVCVREMPELERVHRAYGGRVAVVGVNPQRSDTDEAQARLVADTGITYPTVRDPDDRLTRLFSPSGALPVTVLLDADGVVRDVHRGLLTEQLLRARLADVLGVQG